VLKVNQRPQLLLRQVSVYVHATEVYTTYRWRHWRSREFKLLHPWRR